MESTDVMDSDCLFEDTEIQELLDIRDCSAYQDYLALNGKTLDFFSQNGYKNLDKQYRAELKRVAGIVMQNQLREIVDRSMNQVKNFFKGFLTVEEMRLKAGVRPLRIIRPVVYRSYGREASEKKMTYKEKMEDEIRKKNPILAAQIAKRQQEEQRVKEEQSASMQSVMSDAPILNQPDFVHLQEMFNPIFRIDLNVKSYKKIISMNVVQYSFDFQPLEFSLSDQ